MSDDKPSESRDREVWRGTVPGGDDYYADSVFITPSGAIGINCGGSVVVMRARDWVKIGWDRKHLELQVREEDKAHDRDQQT